jgi:hypothetical protein
MQSLLTEHGYIVSMDGIFGSNTEYQLRQFQTSESLTADGICGSKTWAALEDTPVKTPVSWMRFVKLLEQMKTQKYQLSGAQAPSNPPGVSLRNIGTETTNCVLFTGWIVALAFGTRYSGSQWSEWMVSTSAGTVSPKWGPRVCLEWGIGTTAPGEGIWLVQYFTASGGGHSMLVVDYDQETDKILTLESNSAYGLDGCGWGDLGNLREVFNPGPYWRDGVSQTWKSRIDSKAQVFCVRLNVDPKSVQDWLLSP